MKKILYTPSNLDSPEDQGADFVELFFDLVFVYAITMITSFSAHNLDVPHFFQSVLIFWLIWWGWTQFTWSLNAANTKVARVRGMVLVATGVAFIMASSVGESFGPGVLWFSIPYVIVRTIGIVIYSRVTSSTSSPRDRALAFAIPSFIGLLAIIIGSLVEPSQRTWWWLGAIAIDMFASYLAGRTEGQDLNPSHFAERHGLIVIIALGESLIVAAHAVSSQERILALIIVGGLSVLVTCLLWWSYFSWINEFLKEHLTTKSGKRQVILGRDAYSILHFPLICGIIGIAVGFEKIMGHPSDALTIPVACALGGGYLFFVGFTALSVWRMSGMLLVPRILITIASTIGIAFSVGYQPFIALIIIALSLMLITFIEWKKCRHH